MRKSEILDPVVRAVVLMREAQNIMSDYSVSVSSHDDKRVASEVARLLGEMTDNLEIDFGVYL